MDERAEAVGLSRPVALLLALRSRAGARDYRPSGPVPRRCLFAPPAKRMDSTTQPSSITNRPSFVLLPQSEHGEMAGSGRSQAMDREQGYRPMTGDYGRAASPREHEPSNFGAFGSASSAGTAAGGATTAHDRHYSEWRQRQIDEIDRDYDEYRREHQSKFESDFSNWRSTRQSKRQMMSTIKEHMQVVGSDDQPVGTVDKVRGDRLILTKGDSPDGQHHSLNCAIVDGSRATASSSKASRRSQVDVGSEERDRACSNATTIANRARTSLIAVSRAPTKPERPPLLARRTRPAVSPHRRAFSFALSGAQN